MFGEPGSTVGISMESWAERNDPRSWVWQLRCRFVAEGERATLATDPADTQRRDGFPFIHMWSASLGPGPGAAWGRRGGESRSPALTSQAGGRCKPANVQLSIRQAERPGFRVPPWQSAGSR